MPTKSVPRTCRGHGEAAKPRPTLLPVWDWRVALRRLGGRPCGVMLSMHREGSYRVWTAL
jgi:hypothetical protein